MSEEQLKAFLDAVMADPGLQEKLKGAANPADLEAIAKEAGFVISADAVEMKTEISEGELEGVAGGRWGQCDGTKVFYALSSNAQACVCPV